VHLPPAGTRHQVGSCPVGLDAVEEPVRAPLRTRQDPQLLSQPFGEILGEVLGGVPDGPLSVLGAALDPAHVDRAQRGHVRRSFGVRDLCHRFVPGVERFPRPGVYKGLLGLVPDRRPVDRVHELVEPRPPHLVVGAGRYLLGERSWRGAPHGVAGVSGRPALHLDRAGVLDLPTHGPPVVLPEPVEYVREEDEPDGLVSVVVRVRVQRRAELAVLLAVEQPARARLELAPPHPPAGVDCPRRRGAWW